MEALSELKRLAETKEQAASFTASLVEEIGEGYHNPLEVLVLLKLNIEALKAVMDSEELKQAAGNELAKYQNEKTQAFGFEITRGSRATYDYTGCNDNVWLELKEEIDFKSKKLTERESFLKSIKLDFGVADTDSGELILPPSKKTTDFFKLTPKK